MNIIEILKSERSKLDAAIFALDGKPEKRAYHRKSGVSKHTAKSRAAISQKMKEAWRRRKKAARAAILKEDLGKRKVVRMKKKAA